MSFSICLRTPGIREEKNLFEKDEKCWKCAVCTGAELYDLLNLPLFLPQQERKLSLQNGNYGTAGNLLSQILTHAAGLSWGQELQFCLLTAAVVKENQTWCIRRAPVLCLVAVITLDFQCQIISLNRYFLVAKRRASKGCPKQELSWGPPPSLWDSYQCPQDVPAASPPQELLALPLCSSSPSSTIWSRALGVEDHFVCWPQALRLPHIQTSPFHTGRLREQQRCPPQQAAALPTPVPCTRTPSYCLPPCRSGERASFCSTKAINVTWREIIFWSISLYFAF